MQTRDVDQPSHSFLVAQLDQRAVRLDRESSTERASAAMSADHSS